MQAMSMEDACKVTKLSRKVIKGLMESGEWDIGEIVRKPGSRYCQYIIWSHKLARTIGVSEAKITTELAKIDAERRERDL